MTAKSGGQLSYKPERDACRQGRSGRRSGADLPRIKRGLSLAHADRHGIGQSLADAVGDANGAGERYAYRGARPQAVAAAGRRLTRNRLSHEAVTWIGQIYHAGNQVQPELIDLADL